jgi:archaellum component FlaG (FlaF/FlaG flagellin family)
MPNHTKLVRRGVLILSLLPILLTSCTLSRSDLFGRASGQPEIHIIPGGGGVYSFGFVDVFTTRRQVFTIMNIGIRTLEVSRLYTSEDSLTEFLLDTSETSSKLEPGESTSFSVLFKPQDRGTSTAELLVESNDPKSGVYSLMVTGTGFGTVSNPPKIVVFKGGNPVSEGSVAHDFGTIDVGNSNSVDFTIMNHTSADVALAVSSILFISGDVTQFNRIAPTVPGNLPTGESLGFSVAFIPQNAQDFQIELEIISDDPNNSAYTFFVRGTGRLNQEPDIRVLQGSTEIVSPGGDYDFGTLTLGSSSTKTFTVENTGSASLSLTNILVSDPNSVFSLNGPLPPDIAPGSSGIFDILFAPVFTTGALQAEVKIESNDPDESPYQFSVRGTAASAPEPDIEVLNLFSSADVAAGSLGHDYGVVSPGDSVTISFMIKNSGNANLTVSSITISSTSEYRLENLPILPLVLSAGMDTRFDADFAPSDPGQYSATVIIENDDPDIPDESHFEFDLSGTGESSGGPDISVLVGLQEYPKNSIYHFNDSGSPMDSDASISRTFTIKNTGSASLFVESILIVSGDATDFSHNLDTPKTISPGGEISFSLTFDPQGWVQGVEQRQSRIQIINEDFDENPYKIDVVGFVQGD